MYKLMLTCTCLGCALIGYSQQTASYTDFNFLVGPSFAVGHYANTKNFARNVGYAKTGEFLKLSVTHLVKNNIGISALLEFQRNPLNTSEINNELSDDHAALRGISYTGPVINPTPPATVSNPYKNWQVEKSAWYVASLRVGAFAEFPFTSNKKFSASFGGDLGVAYASSPDINAQYVNDTMMIVVTQKSKSGFGMAYSINTGLHYKLNAKTKILLNIDYLGTTNISFGKLKTSAFGRESDNNLGSQWNSQMTVSTKQSISSINIGIGLAFLL